MKIGHNTFALALAVLFAVQSAWAAEAGQLARVDWAEYLQELTATAEQHQREATRGNSDLTLTEVGYLHALRYYQRVLELNPGDPGASGSRLMVEAQLERFRRQHRWDLLKMGLRNSFRGSPRTRQLNNGWEMGAGRTRFDLEVGGADFDEFFQHEQWTLSLSRRALPFMVQVQGGIGLEQLESPFEEEGTARADLVSYHASAEVDYTVLPMLRYVLPYVGAGYLGGIGFDWDTQIYDFYFHGSFVRLGTIFSLGKSFKIALDYRRSLNVYGSEFTDYEYQEHQFSSSGAPVQYTSSPLVDDSSKDLVDSWTATQISLELLF
jgi:hypothetical protein